MKKTKNAETLGAVERERDILCKLKSYNFIALLIDGKRRNKCGHFA